MAGQGGAKARGGRAESMGGRGGAATGRAAKKAAQTSKRDPLRSINLDTTTDEDSDCEDAQDACTDAALPPGKPPEQKEPAPEAQARSVGFGKSSAGQRASPPRHAMQQQPQSRALGSPAGGGGLDSPPPGSPVYSASPASPSRAAATWQGPGQHTPERPRCNTDGEVVVPPTPASQVGLQLDAGSKTLYEPL